MVSPASWGDPRTGSTIEGSIWFRPPSPKRHDSRHRGDEPIDSGPSWSEAIQLPCSVGDPPKRSPVAPLLAKINDRSVDIPETRWARTIDGATIAYEDFGE